MKILRVISSVNPRSGGPIEGIRQITPHLSVRGHQTEVVSLDSPGDPWLSGFPVPVHAVGPGRTAYCYTPALPRWLRAHAADYDAVIVHGMWQHSCLGAWQGLHGSATPYFVYTHGMMDPWFKRTYPLKHLKKCLFWPWAERRVLRDARAVFFTSEEERRGARESFAGYQCREVVVSYGTSAPDGDPAALRRRFLAAYPTLEDKRLLLFLGRLHPKKGCDLLLWAFSRVAFTDPALHLVLAGPDDAGHQQALRDLAATLGIAERVTWTGMLSGERKWGAFHAAEAFVLPSHQENFGLAVAEALACGLPVLISDKVNIWREIAEDGAGLVAEDTEAGTTRLLQQWLALTPAQTQQMRHQAQDTFCRRFEIESAAESLIQTLTAHLSAAPRPAPAFREAAAYADPLPLSSGVYSHMREV